MKNIYRMLRLNRKIQSPRLKFGALLMADLLGMRHLSVRIDPSLSCNLRCQMCYFSDAKWREGHGGTMLPDDVDLVAKRLFRKALQVVVGCVAEPTMYRDFIRIVELAKEYRVPYVSLVSNCQLLTKEHVGRLIEIGLDELMVSTHGVQKATYERMMPNASHDKLMAFLQIFYERRKDAGRYVPQLRMNYTVNPDNLDELTQFFEVYGCFDLQTLQIRPIMDMGNTAYQQKDLTPYLSRYDEVVRGLAQECRKRNIVFMANTMDPTYSKQNSIACISEEVRRHVSPMGVWRPDFNWKQETYEAYCRRVGWRHELLKRMLWSDRNVEAAEKNRHRMTYDVNT